MHRSAFSSFALRGFSLSFFYLKAGSSYLLPSGWVEDAEIGLGSRKVWWQALPVSAAPRQAGTGEQRIKAEPF